MPVRPELSAKAQQSLNLPEGFKAYSPYPFAGMNVQASAVALADQEFIYLENFLRLGDGNLRSAWGKGSPIYIAPAGALHNIISFFFYNIGTTQYAAVFHVDGSCTQVNMGSAATTNFGTQFFTLGGGLPACSQWGTQYLLISNNNTRNDYWIWDGSLLYTSGSAAPNGAILDGTGEGYTTAPTVTAFGGAGTGLSVTPTIAGGGVVNLQITNPGAGYVVGDVVQLAFSGGGSDTSAQLTSSLVSTGVAAVNVINAGGGYTSASVGFTGGGGTGAAATATVGTGIANTFVTNGGTGYTSASVSFQGGGGTGATATANIAQGVVNSITITAAGSGYTSAPSVVISGNGTGAVALCSIQGGIITGITVTAAGSGYHTAPTVTITGSGLAAQAQAVLQPSRVSGVNVVAAGSGFTSTPLVTFQGGGGSGATGVAILTGTTIAQVNVTAPGQGYIAVPTVVFVPSGTGAAATAVLQNGQLASITLTNAGTGITGSMEVFIQPASGDPGTGAGAQVLLTPTSIASVTVSSSGTGYTNAPAVVISAGANRSAYAHVQLMPYGVSGSAIETFLQRVWIANPAKPQFGTQPPGGNMVVSAPASVSDFATSDGGDLFTTTDSFLQTKFTGLRQSNGYLYAFGDGSISVISNVQTTGSPPTTTFTYQNVDPQTGLTWLYSMKDFGRSIIFGNETGIYGLYGGTVSKISAKLDQFFTNFVQFPPKTPGALAPSAAIATLFNVKHYLMLVTITDPDIALQRNVMLTWNEREWTVLSQEQQLITFIGSQKQDSNFQAWGTEGLSLFPLFAQPSVGLQKRIDTKLYGTDQMMIIKELLGLWIQAQDNSTSASGISAAVVFNASGLAEQATNDPSVPNSLTQPLNVNPQFQAPQPYFPLWGSGVTGLPFVTIGARFTSQSPDFTIANFMIGYRNVTAMY